MPQSYKSARMKSLVACCLACLVFVLPGTAWAQPQPSAQESQAAMDATEILHHAGVPILAGSDQVVPGFNLHRESELLARAGLTPMEAIRDATTVPTKIFNIPAAGTIAPGQRANLVILYANPLEEIRNIRRV